MMPIKFSIITISYNAENEIRETIKSILKQNYPLIEYIIVDGASTDNTTTIIEECIPTLSRNGLDVKYSSEKDLGISDAFNKGIRKATGDIIGLINAGDCLMPGALNKLNECFSQNEDIDIFYGNTLCIDKKHGLKYLRQIPDNLDLNRMKYDGLIFTHQSAFVRNTVYYTHGLYDLSFKYVMDSDLFLKFYNEGVKFSYVNYLLVSMLAGGISSKASKVLIEENIRISKKYGGHSTYKIYKDWILSWPRRKFVELIKLFPSVWYRLIGEERIYRDESK